MKRKKMTAMNRRLNNITNQEEKRIYRTYYNKERAEFRKQIMECKNDNWKNYCSRHKENYGKLFKMAPGKLFRPHHLMVKNDRLDFKTQEEAELILARHFFPVEELEPEYSDKTRILNIGNYKKNN